MKDFLGKRIEEGSWIVFPTRSGSWLELRLAKVTKVDNDVHIQSVDEDFGKIVEGEYTNQPRFRRPNKLQLPNRCVVVGASDEAFKLTTFGGKEIDTRELV